MLGHLRRIGPLAIRVGLSASIAVLMTCWPFLVLLAFVFCVAVAIAGLILRRSLPTFSLQAMLLMLSLVGCGISLLMQGRPWKEVHRFPGYEINIAMSPDGSLVCCSQGSSIEIRETKTGKPLKTLKMPPAEAVAKGPGKSMCQFAFSNDNETLLTAGWRNEVCLYEWKSGSPRTWSAGPMPRISRSGHRFIGVSAKGETSVYQLDQDEPVAVIPNSSDIDPTFSQLSVQGNFAVVVRAGTTAEVWDVEEKQTICSIPVPTTTSFIASFSPDEKFVAVPAQGGIVIWDIAQCRKLSEWSPPNFDHARAIEWSPDGKRILATYQESIGPSAPGTPAALGGSNAMLNCFLLDQDCNEIAKVMGGSGAFSPSGDRIATVSSCCHILDGRSGALLTVAPTKYGAHSSRSIYFSADGNWLFYGTAPAVHRRVRSERWYNFLEVPAFWGVIVLFTLLSGEFFAAAESKPRSPPQGG